jgi:hypothetical protein
MKTLFFIAAVMLSCTSATIISMMIDKDERRMLAEHEMLVAPKKGHPISYRSMLSLPQKQKEEANQHNQDLAAYRRQNAAKQKQQQMKEANRIKQICQENNYLISELTIMHLNSAQEEQARQHNQRLIAQYKKQK